MPQYNDDMLGMIYFKAQYNFSNHSLGDKNALLDCDCVLQNIFSSADGE